jgi:hypothetical protein
MQARDKKIKTAPLVQRILDKARGEELRRPCSFSQEKANKLREFGSDIILRYLTDETLALVLLQEQIQGMYFDFLAFKKKHPGSAQITAKARAFNRIFSLIAFMDAAAHGHTMDRNEIQTLRSSVRQAREILKHYEEKIKAKDAEIEELKHNLTVKGVVEKWDK